MVPTVIKLISSLAKFKELTDEEKLSIFKASKTSNQTDNSEASTAEQLKKDTINLLLSQAPHLLLPYSKYIGFNDKSILNRLDNAKMLSELIEKDILTQESIDYKFRNNNEYIGIVKALLPHVSVDNAQKTITACSLLKGFTTDSQQHIYSLIKQLGESGILDWDYINDPNGLFRSSNHLRSNLENYKGFISYLISKREFVIDEGFEQAIWSNITYRGGYELFKALLRRYDYQTLGRAGWLLDNKNFHLTLESLKLSEKESELIIELIHKKQSLNAWIMENEYVELYPKTITDIFLF